MALHCTATDVYEGDVVTLSWSTLFNGIETASFAEIDQGIGSVSVGEQSTTVVAPSTATTYTLTVSNARSIFFYRWYLHLMYWHQTIFLIFYFDSIF